MLLKTKTCNMKKIFKRIFSVFSIIVTLVAVAVIGINLQICLSTEQAIQETPEIADADCILVLGCQVRKDGSPSLMLSDRLDRGVELYKNGAAPKLLMSGDHSGDYNEVHTMKQYAVSCEIPSEDIFMDHSGFSTYESLYRAKYLFGVNKVIIVTQKYHLYRALYIAECLGIEAVGVAAEDVKYAGQLGRESREILARVKDFSLTVIKPKLDITDKAVTIGGDGNLTNNGEEFE